MEHRRGFSLMEVVIALSVGSMVMALVANAYVGANKSQALTVGTGLLKSSGQDGMRDLYQNLRSAHIIFDRNTVTDSYLQRLPIKGPSPMPSVGEEPPLNLADIVVPDVEATGEFFVQNASDVDNPEFDESSVGNCIFFIAHEAKAVMTEEPSSDVLMRATGADQQHFSGYTINLYFLARRPQAVGSNPVRAGNNFTYQLMHWRSRPYMDYNEVTAWMKNLKAKEADGTITGADAYIQTKLAKLRRSDAPGTPAGTGRYVGALNLAVGNAAIGATPPALYNLVANTTTYRDLVANTTDRFKTDSYHYALRYNMRDKFGESFMSFNTVVPSAQPTHQVPGLTVPLYALPSATVPYGLEVMVAGDPSHRQVLVRMALAARTQPGNIKVGQAFQQVIQIYASSPEGPVATPTPAPPTATPTPAPAST